MKLHISDEQLAALVICVSVGTLHAIQRGAIPADHGIWSIGAPKFWEPLLQTGLVADEIINVLQTADELDALQQIDPERCRTEVAALIDRLVAALASHPQPLWSGRWEGPPASSAEQP